MRVMAQAHRKPKAPVVGSKTGAIVVKIIVNDVATKLVTSYKKPADVPAIIHDKSRTINVHLFASPELVNKTAHITPNEMGWRISYWYAELNADGRGGLNITNRQATRVEYERHHL
jgi:hypothetical protein